MDPPIVGQTIKHKSQFADDQGNLLDVSATVKCTVRKPDGTMVALTPVTVISTGKYSAKHTPDTSGVWWVRWEGTASGDSYVSEKSYTVVAKQVVAP